MRCEKRDAAAFSTWFYALVSIARADGLREIIGDIETYGEYFDDGDTPMEAYLYEKKGRESPHHIKGDMG